MGSYLVPSPLPDASATQRGAVSTGAQELAGDKTFKGNVTVEGTLTAPGLGGGGAVSSVTEGNGLSLTAGDLAMGAASDVAAGAVTTGDQTLGGAASTKTFASLVATVLATLTETVTNLVRAVGASLVLRSDAGALASDVAVKVGTSVADGSVHASAKVLSVSTGLGGTEVEKLSINKAGTLTVAGNIAATGQYFIGGSTTGFDGVRVYSGNVRISTLENSIFVSNSNVQVGGGFGAVQRWEGSTGKILIAGSDSSGTPGAATINKPTGKSAVASGATSVRITNSLVAAGDQVHVTMHGDCGQRHWVTTGAGYFDLNLAGAATADTAFCWAVAKRI